MTVPRLRAALVAVACLVLCQSTAAGPLLEDLSRGVVAVHRPDGSVFVGWRLLGTDPAGVAFNVYRATAAGESADPGPFGMRGDAPAGPVKLNREPLTGATWFVDPGASLHRATSYFVRAVHDGREGEPSRAFTLAAGAPPLPYHAIPLDTPPGYTPNDASAGDLDGDGDYEIIVKQEVNPQDNSRSGVTGRTLLQAYRLDGQRLWTIDLGRNIREGAHYTMFLVADLDGDGRAEVACRTADGTVDGVGKVIGDPAADWREPAAKAVPTPDASGSTATPRGRVASLEGRVLRGPEYLTVFDGRTGAALATTTYLPRRHPDTDSPTPGQMTAIWGDGYANRSDRFLAAVAYLDGRLPSLVFCRGYYTRATLAAWDWRGGKLTLRWLFDSDDGTAGNAAYRGQGNHNLSVADVDGDGRQEIVYGAAVIDDDGKGLYSTGWGHGDAMHVSDLDPANPGLEVMSIQERFDGQGINVRDARTGRPLLLVPSAKAAADGGDKGEGPGRGNAVNIDPRFPGSEVWAAGAGMDGLWNQQGRKFLERRPRGLPCNFAVWWDGDLLRELLDANRVVKWDWEREAVTSLLVAQGAVSNNGTKATPALSADLWGDWREEIVWRSRDNRELRIYTSTIPTRHRLVTLMHDPQYRMAVAWQNTAYNQPPHPSFALDESLPLPAPAPVEVARPAPSPRP
jgi:rhamnogalacturonan endolyase